MGSHGNASAVSYFRRRVRLRSRAHDFHYSIQKRCSKLGRYVSLNEIHVLYLATIYCTCCQIYFTQCSKCSQGYSEKSRMQFQSKDKETQRLKFTKTPFSFLPLHHAFHFLSRGHKSSEKLEHKSR